MTDKEALRHLKELLKSPGWAYLKSRLERAMVEAAQGLADIRPMSQQEIDFRRGSIYAASSMVAAPERLVEQLTSAVLLDEARNIADRPMDDVS